MKTKQIQQWVGKDIMIEIDKNGFCVWKMIKSGKKYEKDYWIIDGSLFKETRKFTIYEKAGFELGKELDVKVAK